MGDKPELKTPENGAKVPVKQDINFTWTAVEGNKEYGVAIFDNERYLYSLIIVEQVTEASFVFDEAGDYQWNVNAADYNTTSDTFSLTVVDEKVVKRFAEDSEPTGASEEPETEETDEPTGMTEDPESEEPMSQLDQLRNR